MTMRNRKNVIVAFVLVAVMLMAVGYAALTDILDITGSADVNQSAAEEAFNEDIYFVSAAANQEGNTASVNTDNNDKASFTAKTLKGAGDKATFTFVITNDGDVDAEGTPKISSNTNEAFFKITSDWMVGGVSTPKTLAAGSQLSYTVTVELLQTPTETIGGSFVIELTAVGD